MSQDYFLKKTYDAVYKANKPRSPFRSLSESYRLVCEKKEAPPFANGFDKDVVVIDETSWEGPQISLYSVTNKTDKNDVIGAEETVARDKEGKPLTGVGPGEYSVASLISGYITIPDCAKLISGQGNPYDVSWPSEADPVYKFEVKQEGSVRVGKMGRELGNTITGTVWKVLDNVKKEYEILAPEEQKTINKEILRRLHVKKEDWTLDGFINAVTKNLGELSLSLLTSEKYTYRLGKNIDETTSENVIERSKYFITSILTLLKTIEKLHGVVNTDREDKEEEDKESVQAIKNTLQKYYGIKDSDKSKQIDDVIDDEAHKVDRSLTVKKLNITKEGGATYSEFCKAIKKLKLSKKIEALKEKLEDKDNIRKLFPYDANGITGLFIVSKRGWRYIPSDKIGEHVVITNISMGNPKIALK
jgi:hypothetical protein